MSAKQALTDELQGSYNQIKKGSLLSVKVIFFGEYLAKLQARAWSHAL